MIRDKLRDAAFMIFVLLWPWGAYLWAMKGFHSSMENHIDLAITQLGEAGMSLQQIQPLRSALRSIDLSVSSFVGDIVASIAIGFLGVLGFVLVGRKRKRIPETPPGAGV